MPAHPDMLADAIFWISLINSRTFLDDSATRAFDAVSAINNANFSLGSNIFHWAKPFDNWLVWRVSKFVFLCKSGNDLVIHWGKELFTVSLRLIVLTMVNPENASIKNSWEEHNSTFYVHRHEHLVNKNIMPTGESITSTFQRLIDIFWRPLS